MTKWDKFLAHAALFLLVMAIAGTLGALRGAIDSDRIDELNGAKDEVLELWETYTCIQLVYGDVVAGQDLADLLNGAAVLDGVIKRLESVQWLSEATADAIDLVSAHTYELSQRLLSKYANADTMDKLNALTLTGHCLSLRPPITVQLPGELLLSRPNPS